MKKILVDIYKIKDPYSGLGQFSLNFARELASNKTKDLDIEFLIPPHSNNLPNAIINTGSVNAGFQKRYFPVFNKRYNIWHSLHQFPSHLPGKRDVWILTIHDLNFLFEKSGAKRDYYLKKLQQNVKKADVITTISHYTRSLIEANLDTGGKEIRVIYNGIPDHNEEIQKPAFADEKPFFFSIGIFNPKKNFHTLIPLMNHFTGHKLIIAGNSETPYGNLIREDIRQNGLEGRIILPGKINESEKYWLYSHCEAFVFPSLAEGFGMPVIEAMKAGKPVFLSKSTSLPEIGGPEAYYFADFEPEHMAGFIKSQLAEFHQDESSKAQKIKAHAGQFTWNRCIEQYLELYRSF